MKKILAICLFSVSLLCFSQEYQSAFGIKIGYPGFVGLNGKVFLGGPRYALDNLAGVNFDRENLYVAVAPILEYNKKFGLNEGYNWYAGLGPNLQYYLKGGYFDQNGAVTTGFFFKTDALFGLEYTAPTSFLNAAIEAGPSITIIPNVRVSAFVNLAVRYAIRKRP